MLGDHHRSIRKHGRMMPRQELQRRLILVGLARRADPETQCRQRAPSPAATAAAWPRRDLPARSRQRSSSAERFARIAAAAGLALSANHTKSAPRLIASIPTAPEPAYKSTNREPSTRGPSTLNSVSRRRSLVGRVVMPRGASSNLDRNSPAITLMFLRSTSCSEDIVRQRAYLELLSSVRLAVRAGPPTIEPCCVRPSPSAGS